MQGIYLWTVKRTNGSSLVYVGQSVDIERRRKDYIKDWAGTPGKKTNEHLKRAVLRYGREAVTFRVLELVPQRENLTDRERHWYNEAVLVYGKNNVANKVVPSDAPMLDPEFKKRQLQGNAKEHERRRGDIEFQQRWRAQLDEARQSPRFREAVGEAAKRRPPEVREAHGRRMADLNRARAKTYPGLVSPDGTVYSPITNMRAFCQEHGLNAGAIGSVVRGEKPQYKGWTLYQEV